MNYLIIVELRPDQGIDGIKDFLSQTGVDGFTYMLNTLLILQNRDLHALALADDLRRIEGVKAVVVLEASSYRRTGLGVMTKVELATESGDGL